MTDTNGIYSILKSLNNACCEDFMNYSFENATQTLIKTVRLTFHIFSNDDSPGNFQNNATDKLYLKCNSIL
ncbi:MAG: hypothetical protein WAP17_06660 [Bacteroidales bacterium]|nr:hypothetical protein [Bacteroidales bacterium]